MWRVLLFSGSSFLVKPKNVRKLLREPLSLSLSVRTDLANRPTEPMLVFDLRYTWVSGNVGTLQSGSRQTTPVCDSVTCGSGRTGVQVGEIEGPGYREPALEKDDW